MEKKLEKYLKYRKRLNAINYANYVIGWDSETCAPAGCFEERSNQVGELSEMYYEVAHSADYIETVKDLFNEKDKLNEYQKIEITKVHKDLMNELKIPVDELIEYSVLLAKSQNVWADAKNSNDFSKFAPVLTEIISFCKKQAAYLETPELKGYNVLLDMYEEGMTKDKYDEFFKVLKEEIVPLVEQINKVNKPLPKWVCQNFDVVKQKEFAKILEDVMCFDHYHGIQKESEHPFTSGYGTSDVRITNHYYENLILSSIFSCIHELGHATYELQCNPEFDNTALSGGSTMAMHESQSRFYENIVGRSKEFWEAHYNQLKEVFKDELDGVSLDEFYEFTNYVECSLIRTEADELTYPLHIMVRYEIEKLIIEGDVDVLELPKIWDKLYKEYLGVIVPSLKEGILQDVHWAGGSFGYFPTYALGSAYAAQLYYAMQKDINVCEAFKKPNLEEVNAWLKEHVHKYGASLTPKEILLKATGEEFNPQYYVKYLKDKYTKLYKLS